MKTLAAAMLVLLVLPSAGRATPPGSGWTTVLADDFDYQGSPDSTKWDTCFPGGRCTNGHAVAAFTPDEPLVSGGWLYLWATRCSYDPTNCVAGYPWKSSMIRSKRSFLYGYMEIRWKLSPEQGFHPTFWLLPADGTWPPEVDISEFKGSDPSSMFMTLHWPNSTGGNAHTGGTLTGVDFAANFHTAGIRWQPGSIDWYVDGVKRQTLTQHIPQKPMYVIVTLEVGSLNFDGYPPANLLADGEFVEFVRVWQQCNGCDCMNYPLP